MSAEVRRLGRGGDAVADVPRYWFRSSHGVLLRPLAGASDDVTEAVDLATMQCDAVLVPSHRHPERLGFAADLAARLGCALVVVCASDREAAIVRLLRRRLRQPSRTLVLGFAWPAPMPLDGLLTPGEPGATSLKHHDVAAKRNTGLALARMLRWHRMLFLDDDVRGLRPPSVRRACRRLGTDGMRAVSWHLRRFEDNSVVCHARRFNGLEQDIFIGGGALAVNVTSQLPIFPPVYNEDWLFLHRLLHESSVEVGGDVRQLWFDPFGLPERALEEEFGDILAEGLFHLLHWDADLDVATRAGYWTDVVAERRALVRALDGQLRQRMLRPGGRPRLGLPVRSARLRRVVASLAAAAEAHSGAELPDQLASFVRAWQADLQTWQDWYAGLPQADDVEGAWRLLAIPGGSLTVIEGSGGR